MLSLMLAAASFAGLHLLVSGTRVRDALVSSLGELAYRGVFSVASAALLGWLIWSYNRVSPPQVTALVAWRDLAALLMVPAVVLVVFGLLTPGPTGAGTERKIYDDSGARGIHRVTRHPFLWGVALWAAVHLAYNTDTPNLLFFGTFLVVAVVGTFSIDAKRSRRFGDAWERYRNETSNLPFGAVLQKRNHIVWREFGLFRPVAAIAAYALIVLFHTRLFGLAPF